MPAIPTSLLSRKVSPYGQRELSSVVIPGTILLIELWLLLTSRSVAGENYLEYASKRIEDVNDWILVAALLLAVLAAYTLGLLARMLAWLLFGWYRESHFLSGAEVREHFVDDHDRAPVDRALEQHDALVFALGNARHDAFFQYAKLWLRQHRPHLAVENHETEINFLVAIQIPLFVAPFVVLRHAGVTWPFLLVAVAWAVVAAALFAKAKSRSDDETKDVMRNFLFAQWYSETEPQPASAPPSDDSD